MNARFRNLEEVPVQHDHVGVLARFDRTGHVVEAQRPRAVELNAPGIETSLK